MGKRFVVLDSFRGIAAILLAIYHLNALGFISNSNIVKNADLYVDFFFVLSGFVIAYRYSNNLRTKEEFFSFIKRRFARIWPLHIFMTLLFVPFVLVGFFVGMDIQDRFSLYSFLNNLVLVQALGVNSGDTWNFPSWSISVEFYTYLLFGLVVFLFSYKRLGLISIILSLLGVVMVATFSSMSDGYQFAFFRCIYSFFLGVVAFKVHDKITITAKIELVLTLFIIASLVIFKINDFYAYFYPIIFFMVIIVFSHESGVISNFLKGNIFQRIGVLSFSIYLTHAWLVFMFKSLSVVSLKITGYTFLSTTEDEQSVIDFGVGELNNIVFIPYLLMVYLMSSLTYKYIEKPAQKYLLNMKKK